LPHLLSWVHEDISWRSGSAAEAFGAGAASAATSATSRLDGNTGKGKRSHKCCQLLRLAGGMGRQADDPFHGSALGPSPLAGR